ncbi:MAG: hypothetical protein M3P27_09915 [Acidobacteriota bacterium]|nr:hypothetical protein [Acidobacteriota bacterium]
MKPLYKGLVIAAIHVALVTSLGAKLLYDRHTRPRVWAQARPYDPDLPIRGRYLSLQLIIDAEGFPPPKTRSELWQWGSGERRARLEVRSGKLVAVRDETGDHLVWFAAAPGVVMPRVPDNLDSGKQPVDFPVVAVLSDAVLYFIPEHAQDPTPRANDGSELWAEVTLPKKGPPRPIQLALKKNGAWSPLDLR